MKAVTFGELMLRLAPEGYNRFVQSERFGATFGGGEANVAVSLANYGIETSFVTKLPAHEIGQMALNSLRRYGVETRDIVRGGERIGIYYLEKGASQRPSKVIYDRAHSAIAEAEKEDFDWEKIFEGAQWFHFTGITPALSKSAAEICLEACKKAKEKGLTVSCDLNYRKKLWTPAEAQACMSDLMRYVDVCIGNEEDAEKCLGFKPEGTDVKTGALDISGYEKVFRGMKEKFGFSYIATSLRESYSASDNGWSALVYDGREFYRSRRYDIRIVDRVGGGDSFSAGLIHGLLVYGDHKKALEFAAAASALKHTVEGDVNLVSAAEVETLMSGDGSGRVQR